MEAPRLTIARARELRRKLTLPEGLLWIALRGRKLAGLRFRRQHPVGPYILDFYCEVVRLAVEVDGQGHEQPDQIAHDHRRTAWLEARGMTVLRIPAREVLGNFNGVLASIKQCAAADPLPRRSGGPPPPVGKE